jgi:hypothetical protein
MDIRLYTRVIIRKNGRYLQCKSMVSGKLIWSPNLYDAWWTRDAEAARVVARKTGGIRMLWNPIVGKVEVM